MKRVIAALDKAEDAHDVNAFLQWFDPTATWTINITKGTKSQEVSADKDEIQETLTKEFPTEQSITRGYTELDGYVSTDEQEGVLLVKVDSTTTKKPYGPSVDISTEEHTTDSEVVVFKMVDGMPRIISLDVTTRLL